MTTEVSPPNHVKCADESEANEYKLLRLKNKAQ